MVAGMAGKPVSARVDLSLYHSGSTVAQSHTDRRWEVRHTILLYQPYTSNPDLRAGRLENRLPDDR